MVYVTINASVDITAGWRHIYLDMHQSKYKIWQGKNGKWYTYLPDETKKSGRVQRERNTRKEVEDIAVAYWREQAENPTIKEVFEEWRKYQLVNEKISKATDTYNVQLFEKHFTEFGKKRIKAIKASEVSKFIEMEVPKYQLKSRRLQALKTLTKQILSYARREEYTTISVEAAINDVNVSKRELAKSTKTDKDKVLTTQEYMDLMQYLTQNRDIHNIGLLLICLTGMRIGEVVALKSEDIGENYIYVRRTESRYYDEDLKKWIYEVKDAPKTDAGIRMIPITTKYRWIITVLKNLNPFNANDGYLFVKDGKRMHTECFRKRLYRVCGYIEIPRRSPHAIRMTFATNCRNNGMDERTLLSFMGHTDITTTETYYHKDIKTIPEKTTEIDRMFGCVLASKNQP